MTKKTLIAKIHYDVSQLDDAVIEACKTMLRFNLEQHSDDLMPFVKADFATHTMTYEDPNLARSSDEAKDLIANAMADMLTAHADDDEDDEDEDDDEE